MTVERLRLALGDLPPERELYVAGPGGAYRIDAARTDAKGTWLEVSMDVDETRRWYRSGRGLRP